MERIEKSIDVRVPVNVAYNQWTQFEEFPRFMEGVVEVRQTDDRHMHWVAEIGGKQKEWDAEISEQVPDQRIAWHSVDGTRNDGTVEFAPISSDETHVTVTMEYDPEGFLENVADFFGATSHRVEEDLERFKDFVESRGHETGVWRGSLSGAPQGAAEKTAYSGEQTASQLHSTGRQEMGREETVIPEVREELKVGKRQVETGGVRVQSEVKEERVEEAVRLREEHVKVEHRQADRPLQPGEDAFRERNIEMRETAEEPVVSKQARVVGEVAVGKEASERVEKVGDTVRSTEVHVDRTGSDSHAGSMGRSGMGTSGMSSSSGIASGAYDDSAFRTHYQSRYASLGGSYADYDPAYRYGYGLSESYPGRNWNDIESDVQRDWESRQPGTWERFKDAVKAGWERTKQAMH